MTRLRLGLLTATFFLPLCLSCAAPASGTTRAQPVIRLQPASQTAPLCGDARFEVSATGSPPLAYQWFRDGTPIPGEFKDSLVVEGVVPEDDGLVYSVTVSNAAGAVTSEGAALHVDAAPAGPATQVLSAREGWLIAVSANTVAWTDGTGVYAAPARCGRPVRTVYLKSQLLEGTAGIALNGDRVVWTDSGTGRVLSAPTRGGPATVLASLGGKAEEITVAGSYLYWPQPLVGIRSMPAGGGAVTTTSLPGSWNDGIAVDDLYVYWNDLAARTVNKMPLAGGEITVLAGGQGFLGGIATDGTSVYWASTDEATTPPTGSVLKIHRDGGAPTRLASEPVYPLNIAVDSGMVYWTASNLRSSFAGSGSVSRVPADGSAAPTMLASGGNPFGIAVDGSFVYWTELAVGGGPGRVMRVPR